MEEKIKKNPEAKKKLSYEDLQKVAGELQYQNQQLNERLKQANMYIQQMNMDMQFKHLDYLFKVLENKECFDSDFVITCAEDIKTIISIPEEEKEEKKEE